MIKNKTGSGELLTENRFFALLRSAVSTGSYLTLTINRSYYSPRHHEKKLSILLSTTSQVATQIVRATLLTKDVCLKKTNVFFVLRPSTKEKSSNELPQIPQSTVLFPHVNSRVMFTTHRRLMCTSHNRTYVYRSGAVEGVPHLGCRQG